MVGKVDGALVGDEGINVGLEEGFEGLTVGLLVGEVGDMVGSIDKILVAKEQQIYVVGSGVKVPQLG